MLSTKADSRYFVIGLFLATIVYSPIILDHALVPRFGFLALFLLLTSLLMFAGRTPIRLQVDRTSLFYLFTLLLVLLSCVQSIALSEAYFSAGRTLLGSLVFLYGLTFLQRPDFRFERFFKWTVICAISCFLIEILAILKQVIEFVGSGLGKPFSQLMITGLNSNRNLLGSYLFLLLAFLLAGWWFLPKTQKKWMRFILLLLFLVIIYTRARAVMIAMLLMIFVFGMVWLFRQDGWRWLKGTVLVFPILGLLMVLIFLLAELPAMQYPIVEQLHLESWINRVEIWKKTVDMILEYPVFGVGAGHWKITFPRFFETGFSNLDPQRTILQTPHNDFLQLMAEAGIPASFSYLSFVAIILYRGLINTLRMPQGNEKKAFYTLWLFLLGYQVISLVDFPGQRMEHLMLSQLLMASIYHRTLTGNKARIKTIVLGRPILFLISVLCASLVYVSWLRHQGEYHTRFLYQARKAGQHMQVDRFGKKSLSFAYQLDPVSIPIDWYRGNALASVGKTKQAYASFQHAYAVFPDNIYVMGDLATAELIQGNVERAEELYLSALSIYSKYDDGNKNLAILYLNRGELGRAVKMMNTMSIRGREAFFIELYEVEPVPVYTEDVRTLITETLPVTKPIEQLKFELSARYSTAGKYDESLFWAMQIAEATEHKLLALTRLRKTIVRNASSNSETIIKEQLLSKVSTSNPKIMILAHHFFATGESDVTLFLLEKLSHPIALRTDNENKLLRRKISRQKTRKGLNSN